MSETPGRIITPEAVVLDFRTAGLATRSVAKLIDVLALGALLFVSLLGFSQAALDGTTALIVGSLVVFTVLLVVPATVETLWNGRSPGKAALGLRVVTTDGGPIAFRHALVRGLLQLVELPTGIAMVVALANPRSQRVGDLLAGTFVLRVRSDSSSTAPIAFYPPPGCEHYVDALDVTRLDSQQFLLIRKLLLRVGQLDGRARYDLAVRLATPIRARVTPQPPAGMGPELYLVCVASAFQIRNGGLPQPLMAAGVAPGMAPPAYVPNGVPGYYPSGGAGSALPPPLPTSSPQRP